MKTLDLVQKFEILTKFPNVSATIRYVNEDGEVKERTISHIKPPHLGKNWHYSVNAYDDIHREFRTFRLDRMEPLVFWQTVTDSDVPVVIDL